MDLTGREIVLGVTGGIAAYKSAEVVSRLRHLGANVHVIMTRNATEFITPLTFQTLSFPVSDSMLFNVSSADAAAIARSFFAASLLFFISSIHLRTNGEEMIMRRITTTAL